MQQLDQGSQPRSQQPIIWQPQSGPQTEFHRRPEFEVLYGGAAGGGKSDSLLIEGLRQADMPTYRAIIFRRTFPELQELIDRSLELFPRCIPGAKWNEQKKRWTFPSGATYRFAHMQHEADKHEYQGHQYQYIAFDELTHFTEGMYLYLISRCRTADPRLRCYVRAATNPGGVGHGWVKRRFIDVCSPVPDGPRRYEATMGVWWQPMRPGPAYTDPDTGLLRAFIPSRVFDNRKLVEADPQYIKRLLSLSEDERRALLEGDWDVFSGQYFREFRREKHVVDPPFMPPPSWVCFASMDWGFAAPCAVLWHAVDPASGRVVTYRELYVTSRHPSEVAVKFKELSAGEDIRYVKASPDMWQERGLGSKVQGGESIAEVFINAGIPLEPADNRRVIGWTRVREYLRDAPDDLPWWRANSCCENLLRTLPELIHDERNVEDVDGDCEDHAPEALRYALMSRPSPISDDAGVLAGGWPGAGMRNIDFDTETGLDEDDDDEAGVGRVTFYSR